MDRAWWLEYGSNLKAGSEWWTSNREAAAIFGLCFVHATNGIDAPSCNAIYTGGNSGFQALSLALLWGAADVTLLGYDMQPTGGALHWHDDHAHLGNPRKKDFTNWQGNFAVLASQTATPIFNASRMSALSCFPQIDLLQALGSTLDIQSPSAKPRSSKASRTAVTKFKVVSQPV